MFSRFEAFILVMKEKKKLRDNIERSESISRGIVPPFTDVIL